MKDIDKLIQQGLLDKIQGEKAKKTVEELIRDLEKEENDAREHFKKTLYIREALSQGVSYTYKELKILLNL